MKRNPDLRTPWSASGLLHHPGFRRVDANSNETWPDVQEWRDNEPFEAVIQFKGTERGRSAAFFRWENVDTGQMYPMFISDIGHMIMQGTRFEEGGTIRGRWYVVKRGQNYGIRLEDPTEPQDGTTERTEQPAGA